MPTTQNEGLAENSKPQAASPAAQAASPAAQAASRKLQALLRKPQAASGDLRSERASLASIKAQIDAIPDADQRELIRKQVFGNPKHPDSAIPKGAVPLNSLAGLACIFPGLKAHHK